MKVIVKQANWRDQIVNNSGVMIVVASDPDPVGRPDDPGPVPGAMAAIGDPARRSRRYPARARQSRGPAQARPTCAVIKTNV